MQNSTPFSDPACHPDIGRLHRRKFYNDILTCPATRVHEACDNFAEAWRDAGF